MRLFVMLMMCGAFVGCVPAATTPDEDDGADEDGEGGDGDAIVTEKDGDSWVSVVDSRDAMVWQRFDFETRSVVDESADWDLGFSRFNVETAVEVAVLRDQDYAALTQAPADGYTMDNASADPADMETMPGYAFDLWYVYDTMTHVLTADASLVYVVHTPEGNYFKVQMLDYYDEAGTSGYVSMRWAAVAAP